MNEMQAAVHEFLLKHLGASPSGWPNKTGTYNKWLLVKEEFDELTEALGIAQNLTLGGPRSDEESRSAGWSQVVDPDEPKTVDAICDLLYVIFNLCEEMELDIAPFFDEVHRSNLTKIPAALSPNKKVQKGPAFEPPCIAGLLALARAEKTQAKHERVTDATLVFFNPKDDHA